MSSGLDRNRSCLSCRASAHRCPIAAPLLTDPPWLAFAALECFCGKLALLGKSHTQVIATVTMEGKRLEWPDSAHPAIAVSRLHGHLLQMSQMAFSTVGLPWGSGSTPHQHREEFAGAAGRKLDASVCLHCVYTPAVRRLLRVASCSSA